MHIVARAIWFLPFVAVVSSTQASVCEGDVAGMRRELEELRHTLQTTRDIPGSPALSFLTIASTATAIATDSIQHILDNTDIDDKIIDFVSVTFKVATNTFGGVIDKLFALEHHPTMKFLRTHAKKSFEVVQRYSHNYVATAADKVTVYSDPAINLASDIYRTIAQTMERDVLPVLRGARSHVTRNAPRFLEKLEDRLDRLVTPTFDALARISPKHAQDLPRTMFDRALLVCIALVIVYYCVRMAINLMRIGLVVFIAITHMFAFPVYILWKVLGFMMWCATGFYCCGRCARRRSAKVAKLSAKAAVSTSNNALPNTKSEAPNNAPKIDGQKVLAASPKKANLADVSAALRISKKKGNIDSFAKLLVSHVNTGKPMEGNEYPTEVRGKQLEKDVLKKALGNFKDVDLKKLNF